MSVIETEGLTKRFGRVVAVDGVSLSVPEGARFGLLGPNGSGKTTLVRMLLGLVHPTAGRVALLGRPMPRHAAQVLPRVGALVEGPAAWPQLSGRANLRLLDAAGRSGRRDRAERVEEALVRVGLGGIDARPVRAYSLGMRQRLGIAAALLRKPELLLLDEPTNGLDPRGIGEMRALLRHFAAQGTTVVLSSHLLSEVEALCSQVGVMSAGRLVLTADLESLRVPTGLVEVRTPDPAAAVGVLDGQVVHRNGDLVVVRADDPAALNARLVAAGVAVRELTALRRTLEQVVLELTGPSADRVDRPGADPTSAWRPGRAADARGSGRPPRADVDPAARTDPGGGRGWSDARGSGRADDRAPGVDPATHTNRADGRGSGWADAHRSSADPAARTDRADSRESGWADANGSGADPAARTDRPDSRGNGWADARGSDADPAARTDRADGSRS